MDMMKTAASNYKDLLKDYVATQDEKSLYGAEKISKAFIKNNILPDEIIDLHIKALHALYPDLETDMKYSMKFLLETMILYGTAHQQFQALQEKQLEIKSEIAVAADMQETLLATTKPEIAGLDIGAISKPAHQMNGDYYHFIKGRDDSLGVAIADVAGKGVPAALCMSMIKYAMDSLHEEYMSPKSILKNLNRVVERNVDPGMFITMFYMQYFPNLGKLCYSSAGHEPGYYFNSKKNCFEEIKAQGLVLGVSSDAAYNSYRKTIYKGDMVVLLTDGVTECRQGDRFIEIDEVLDVIQSYSHLPAQEMVEQTHMYFERKQNFKLRDDFTLIILKKEV